jgi:glycosyltransferase involved in cell wall biosynthesis
VPVYNERATIEEIVRRIQAVDIEKEIVIVDDASTDGTREFLMTLDARIKSGAPASGIRNSASGILSEEEIPNAGCATATPGCATRVTPAEEGVSVVLSHIDGPVPSGGGCDQSEQATGVQLRETAAAPPHLGIDIPLPLGGGCERGEQATGVPLSETAAGPPLRFDIPLPLGEGGPRPAFSPAGAGRVRGLPEHAAPRSDAIRIFFQDKNRGKGAALRRGFKEARGRIVLIQDADLEYDPQDYFALIDPIRRGQADVVYGSRFLGGPHRVLLFWHYVGNKFLTTLSDMLTDLNLSDVWTCYKAFTREVLERIEIEEDRFGFEQEITVKISKNSWRVYEVPISYFGRNYSEGKKITWRDGFRGLWCMLRYSLKA